MFTLEAHLNGTLVLTKILESEMTEIGSTETQFTLKYPTISKKHASIRHSDEKIYFTDHSRNGSFLLSGDSRKKIHNSTCEIELRDKIAVGPFILSLRHHQRNPNPIDTFALKQHLFDSYVSEPEHIHEKLSHAGLEAECIKTLADDLHSECFANGPLEEWLQDPNCKEILINRFDQIYVDLGDGLKNSSKSFLSKNSYETWASRTALSRGRRLDQQHPICEATLENGARFHATLPPISMSGTSVSIRKFGSAPISEVDALNSEWLNAEQLSLLKDAIRTKKNIVISGGTSSGKTSLLNFLCQFISPSERVITIEDTVELHLPIENVVQLQARDANSDGIGQVTIRQLIASALRMRPDRIIVGECRGAEVLDMLQALNTGHPGSLTTLHANSPKEALQRLELLTLLGSSNLSRTTVSEWLKQTIDIIVQVQRNESGSRSVCSIMKVKE